MNLKNIKTSSDFAKEISQLVTDKDISFFDAVIHYCEINNLEVETVASMIKQSTILKSKIQYEAEELNLMRKTARLPI
jgi:hypothetical protein